jgi:hypothetical protein
VDTGSHSYDIEFALHIYWTDADATSSSPTAESEVWTPEYVFTNALAEVTVVDRAFDANYKGAVGQRRIWARYRAKLWSMMDFHNFPFDQQALKIIIRVPRVHVQGIKELTYTQSADSMIQTPNLGNDEYLTLGSSASVVVTAPGKTNFKPEFHVIIEVERYKLFYLFSIIAPMAGISFLSLNAFLMGSDIDSRTELVVTLTLTLVAFKFATNDKLPHLGYPTVFDKYLGFAFSFTIFTAIFNAVARIFFVDDDGTLENFNKASCIVMGMYWLAGTAWILSRAVM